MSTVIDEVFDPLERRFLEGAAQGRLLLPNCQDCEKPHWYPRPVCPYCSGRDISLVPASGRGTVYSLTRLPRKDGRLRTIAYIRLEEGVTMLSQVLDEEGRVGIDQAVEVTFMHAQEGQGGQRPTPVFRAVGLEGVGND